MKGEERESGRKREGRGGREEKDRKEKLRTHVIFQKSAPMVSLF